MQDKKMKTEIVLLAVPAEMLLEAGIFEGDPMQMYVDGKKLVIENLDDVSDIVCEGDCEDCPVDQRSLPKRCQRKPSKSLRKPNLRKQNLRRPKALSNQRSKKQNPKRNRPNPKLLPSRRKKSPRKLNRR